MNLEPPMRWNTEFQRSNWVSILAISVAADVESQWLALATKPAFHWIRKPEFGSVMVRGRSNGTGVLFNLGEMTVTRCALRIEGGERGIANIAGRNSRHAEHAALFDAALQGADDHLRDVAERSIELLRGRILQRRTAALHRATSSTVDFSMMMRQGSR